MRHRGFIVFFSITWLIGLSLSALILFKWFAEGVEMAEAVGYQKGYKDALYKRPVSEDLEMVCAGIWVGKENEKYIAKETKK